MPNDQYQPQYQQTPRDEQPQQQQAQAQPQEQQNKRPEDTVKDGNIKASIWRRQGKHGDYFTASLAKTYRDRDGNLKDTNNYGKDDLLRVAEVARRANVRMIALNRDEFMRSRQEKSQRRSQNREDQSR